MKLKKVAACAILVFWALGMLATVVSMVHDFTTNPAQALVLFGIVVGVVVLFKVLEWLLKWAVDTL